MYIYLAVFAFHLSLAEFFDAMSDCGQRLHSDKKHDSLLLVNQLEDEMEFPLYRLPQVYDCVGFRLGRSVSPPWITFDSF